MDAKAPRRLGVFVVVIFLLAGLILNPYALAQDNRSWKNPFSSPTGSGNFRKKVETKEKSRWTLKDWLEQKDRNRMMDLWAGMYAPSPYELIFSVSQMDYSQDIDNPLSKTPYKSIQSSVAFYALILGIEANYENNASEQFRDTQGLVNFRLAGNSNQSTHLNLQLGVRNRSMEVGGEITGQALAGAQMDLYIERHSGLHGLYRYYSPKDNDTLGSISGQRTEAGIFFDIYAFRLYGNWFSDSFNSDNTTTGNKVNRTRTGWQYGLKAFF